MRLILSPAKKMRVDTDTLAPTSLPEFLPMTRRLLERLRTLSYQELKTLWQCSDAIAAESTERLQQMDLRSRLTPALLAYDGIQYKYMAPQVFTEEEFAYVQEHVRILSGFYGLLRPFDGVTPYRLEMQAKLSVDGAADLYAFWGGLLARRLAVETDTVVDLASEEYSRSVVRHLAPPVRLVRCIFGELQDGRVVGKGVRCKMARGEMIRFMAERQAAAPEEMLAFDRLGYRFSPERSEENCYVFLKCEK